MRTMRRKEVKSVTGLSASQIDRMEAAGHFPRARPPQCENSRVGDEEISEWLRARVAERDAKAAEAAEQAA